MGRASRGSTIGPMSSPGLGLPGPRDLCRNLPSHPVAELVVGASAYAVGAGPGSEKISSPAAEPSPVVHDIGSGVSSPWLVRGVAAKGE